MNLIRVILSEWMKTKRTPFRYIAFLVPILFPISILAYISIYKVDYTFQIKVYETYFSTISTGLTMIAGILTCLNVMCEDLAGEFRRMLIVPLSRNTIYIGKLFMLVLVTIVDMFISTLILLVGIKFIYPDAIIQSGVFLQGTILTTIGALFLYGLYLILSIKYSVGFTMLITTCGTVLGALLQTGLGDKIWEFVPWAWAGRVGIVGIYKLDGLAKFRNINNDILHGAFVELVSKGIFVSIMSLLIICIVGVVWFKKWEGVKTP